MKLPSSDLGRVEFHVCNVKIKVKVKKSFNLDITTKLVMKDLQLAEVASKRIE
jgi:hypothetical protein